MPGRGSQQTPQQTPQQARESAMTEAQAVREQAASDAVAAREFTDPSATFSRGVEGANVETATAAIIEQGAPVVTTYEDALEAGYIGVTPGHANTEKLSVQAVAERDQRLGLPGTRGLRGASVNGAGENEHGDPDDPSRNG